MNGSETGRGREYGGIGWVIKRDLRKIDCNFINERISYIRLNNIAVIGVYMPCNDQTKIGLEKTKAKTQ